MAVTKIKPIRGTVNKALAYILDPQKTDDAFYVSSYGCAASDAAAKEFEWTRNLAVQQGVQMPKVLARHLIQSFDIGEVTPEEAHEVGKQLADEWLKGKYEYVIATHIDKGHCHNHIIFNAVNYVDFHAYRSNKRTYRELRQLSDEICKEHGLSVIPPSQNKGVDYKEYTEAKRGTSWKQKLKQTIDRLVITAKDYDDFLRLMQEAGYEIKTGKYISFRAEGQERFTRSKTIGENYTEERIKERIAGRTPRRSQRQTLQKGISLIGDIQERIKLIDSKGYEHKAMVYHMDEDGRAVVLLPHGVLFRGAAEEVIRKHLIQKLNVLDAVIGLPANLFFGTGIPVCVLVLKRERNGNSDNILFIDASSDFEAGKNQNILRECDIDKIVETYERRQDVDKYAHVATMQEIEENGFNLNIPRYVDTFEPEEEIDLNAVAAEIRNIQAEIKGIDAQLKPFFDELGLDFPFDVEGK